MNRLDRKKLWDKASSLKGCLSGRKCEASRRKYVLDEDPLANISPFVSDEAKLFSSKSFRVMSDKTQVFTRNPNPLVRSREKHVLEVVAVSVVTSDLLGLNTDLVRAAAIGHDIGHIPFGHQGEAWLAKTMGRPFCHEVMGPIAAQKIERRGRGLNLTWETLDAMMRHSGNTARVGMSQEAWVLRYTDKFAYLFHDWNDIVERMKYPVSKELRDLACAFGENQRERTTTAIAGLVVESEACSQVTFESSEWAKKFHRFRKLMYEVYPHVTQQNVASTMEGVLEFLHMLNLGDPFLLLALMTDADVIMVANEKMKDMGLFNRTALCEIAPYLAEIGQVDLCNPCLDW